MWWAKVPPLSTSAQRFLTIILYLAMLWLAGGEGTEGGERRREGKRGGKEGGIEEWEVNEKEKGKSRGEGMRGREKRKGRGGGEKKMWEG